MVELWSWLGEPLAVDFADTVRRRGFEYEELLEGPGDLVEWARREGFALPERGLAARLGEVRELRDAVFALLLRALPEPVPSGVVPSVPSPPEAEARLNAALAAVPLVPRLENGEIVLTAPAAPSVLDELMARVAASAVDLVQDPALAFCDAPSCGQFFIRRRGDQRWCDSSCGTRARVARHAAQHR